MSEIERFFAAMKRASEAERKRDRQQQVETYPVVLVGYCECEVCDALFLKCEEAAFLAEIGQQRWQ